MTLPLQARLAQKKAKRTPVEIDVDGERMTLEVRVLNMAQLASLMAKAGGQDENGQPKDMERFTAALVFFSTYEPGTSNRAFSDADSVASAGPWVNPLVSKCFELMVPSEQLAKNSEAGTVTPSPASDSSSPTA